MLEPQYAKSLHGASGATRFVHSARLIRLLGWLSILGLSLVIAAASITGFYTKWNFYNDVPAISLSTMLDGNASRPFAYRRLIVDSVNAVDDITSPQIDELADRALGMKSSYFAFPSAVVASHSKAMRFKLVYLLTYLAAIALLAAGYAFARSEGIEPIAAGAGASLFLLLFPLLQSTGGYFYDYSESAFFLLFLLLARKGWWQAMLVVALFATWNKESFFFFAVTAFPLLLERKSLRTSAVIVAACIIVAGLTYEVQRIRFAANLGSTAESHIADQFHYFISGTFLLRAETTYGLRLPHPFSLPWIVAIGTAVAIGWRWVTVAMRRQIALAALINIPLFLLFCAAGEARNLSMLFPGLLVVIAAAFQTVALHSSTFRPAKALP